MGVKTTADTVFIKTVEYWDSLSKERPELLKPLMTHHLAKRYKAGDIDKQILYPHEVVNGQRKPVNLTVFPHSKSYLEKHRGILEGRAYVIEAGRLWYEIWVPQDPAAWSKPKIVFRDIAESPTFWMDLSGAVVNGDCYWLLSDLTLNVDHLWLALAVGNSSFIESFYDRRFRNKLYAGRRRFMTQYVEQFPVPDPETDIGRCIIKMTKEIYSHGPNTEGQAMEQELDRLVWRAFGLPPEKILGQRDL